MVSCETLPAAILRMLRWLKGKRNSCDVSPINKTHTCAYVFGYADNALVSTFFCLKREFIHLTRPSREVLLSRRNLLFGIEPDNLHSEVPFILTILLRHQSNNY